MEIENRGKYLEERKTFYLTSNERLEKEILLNKLNFVLLPAGKVKLGTEFPIPCRFEGHRLNETPIRELEVESFWINKFTVTNKEFEEFNNKRMRPQTSIEDNQPVTNITYLNTLRYIEWLSKKYGLAFTLPTEPEWIYAAAPWGWEYPYHSEKTPDHAKAHNFILGETEYKTLAVDDLSFGTNLWNLYHMGGNVEEFTLGSYYTMVGNWGAITDGMYCIVKGGNFGHCPLSSGVQRRGIIDISARSERVGFRISHSAF